MKNYERYNKFLVLENNIQQQGLPNIIEEVLHYHPEMQKEVWWFFSQDMRQNEEKCFEKLSKLTNETFIITYPSFMEWFSSFEEQLYIFDKLIDRNIKLRIGVIHQDFYWYIIKWLHGDKHNKTNMNKYIRMLKRILKFHEIYHAKYNEIHFKHEGIFEKLKRVTWLSLEENYYREFEKLKVKATGEVEDIKFIYINPDDPEKSMIELGGKEYKLNEIEKV